MRLATVCWSPVRLGSRQSLSSHGSSISMPRAFLATSSLRTDKKVSAAPPSPLPTFFDFSVKATQDANTVAPVEFTSPLVVVIPWLGCVPYRINERYCRWYSERNIPMLASVPTLSHVLFSGTKQKRAKQLVALLKQRQQKESRPIVFHVLGGEAHLIYGHVLRLIQKDHPELYPSVRGAIIDSAPMPFDQETYLRVLTTWARVYKATPGAWLTYHTFKAFLSVYLRMSRVQTYVAELNTFLAKQQKIPQLYLYGEMDEVASPAQIRQTIDQQVKSGAIVHSQCFEYSSHARHITTHPDAYWAAVERFLKTILPQKK